tara:strand:+ start:994 stop:1233 length:240 start_codon:yes stop_codon:yes gene_type:complete
MSDFGINEWIIVISLFLILIRPKDFPRFFYQLGQWYQKLIRIYYTINDEFISIHETSIRHENKIKSPPNTISQPKTEQN